jgi:hypothetical protein
MELENIILTEVSHGQKVKRHMFTLYADYRPKTNAEILWDTGSHEGEASHKRFRVREGNQKLEYG